jgi:hypothetical protein
MTLEDETETVRERDIVSRIRLLINEVPAYWIKRIRWEFLAELLDGWSPEQEAELVSLLRRVTTTLFSEENKKELISNPA